MSFGSIKTPVLLVAGALVLSGCAETQLVVHSAKELAGTTNKPVPKTKDPKGLTKVSLASDIGGTAESIKLNGLQIGLDSSTLKGDINVASFTGPDLTFEIGIDQINVDNYLDLDPAPAKKATR